MTKHPGLEIMMQIHRSPEKTASDGRPMLSVSSFTERDPDAITHIRKLLQAGAINHDCDDERLDWLKLTPIGQRIVDQVLADERRDEEFQGLAASLAARVKREQDKARRKT